MDGLDFPFKIEIDGKTIAEVDSGDSGPTQAALGSNAAVFKLQDSRLISGDWILARNKSEDRSLLPKQVLWFKLGTETEERAQPVSAHKDGDKYQVKFAGMYKDEKRRL